MPYDLFWHGEPSLYYCYLDAYEKKLDDEEKSFIHKENWKAWLQGWYVDQALACNHPLGKRRPYFNKPIDMEDKDPVDKKEIESDELTKEEEAQAIAQFMAFGQLVDVINNKRKENGN